MLVCGKHGLAMHTWLAWNLTMYKNLILNSYIVACLATDGIKSLHQMPSPGALFFVWFVAIVGFIDIFVLFVVLFICLLRRGLSLM